MVKIIFPKRVVYICQLGSAPLVKQINVPNFKKLFGHLSCDTKLIKTYGLGYMRCATMIRKSHTKRHDFL